MRIAVQFFGHLRTFKKCLPYLRRNLLAYYDCDIFMHTWSTMNHNCATGHFIGGGWNKPVNAKKLSRLLGVPSSRIIIEKQIVPELGHVISSGRQISIGGMTSLWHSMQAVNQLRIDFERDNNVQYDYVVCVRPDVLLNKVIDIPEVIRNAGNPMHGIFCLGDAWHIIDSVTQVWMTDILFFGKPDDISDLMHSLPPTIPQCKDLGRMGPEIFFNHQIKKLGFGPFWITGFMASRDFWILRPLKWNSKRILRIHFKKNKIEVFFCDFLPVSVDICFAISNRFLIDFRIGNIKRS